MKTKVRTNSNFLENLYNDGFALLAAALAGITGILIGLKWLVMDDSAIIGILLGSVSALAINEFKKKWSRKNYEESIKKIEKSLLEIKENTDGKMDEMLMNLAGKFGQGITEEEMLDFYDKLKKDAVEFNVVWVLKFDQSNDRFDEYFENEKKLIKNGMKVRRLIHNEVTMLNALKKYGQELKNTDNYEQRFGYGYKNMEIGYSYYKNPKKEGSLIARGLIILADTLMRPKIGFYFDNGKVENVSYKDITDSIEHMFKTEWERCGNIPQP